MTDAPTARAADDADRAPRATYRLQLGEDLDFSAASDVVDILAALGVSHLYLSPVWEAAPGSTHGYDVADPARVSSSLGGEEGLRALSTRAAQAGMGIVVDVVPNHMAAHTANPHWAELLRGGRGGAAGAVFDVDWRPPLPGLAEKVILPVLGDSYGAVLERGELELAEEAGVLTVAYYDHRFPVTPETISAVERAGGPASFRGTPGDPLSFDHLHALLERQHYRLTHWRVGDRLVNYRRFFTITDLAAVRVEDDDVFDLVHDTMLRLLEERVIHGLRIDHPDGLRDPGRYFARLAERSGHAWTVAEKITHPGERLPDWPIAGTTGYDFCNDVMAVLAIDPTAEDTLTALDRELGGTGTYAEAAVTGKRDILTSGLASDTDRVARLLWAVTQQDRRARDVDLRTCHDAIVGIVAGIEVYRPYVDPQTGDATPTDRSTVTTAVNHAIAANAAPRWLLEFAGSAVLGDEGSSPAHLDLIARFPQLTSAAVAKGTEDTAFYRYRRLLALNEVGGDPGRFGLSVTGFHRANAERAEHHPTAMLTTATHDTKRGEDTRLRIAALSELSTSWAAAVRSWRPWLPDRIDGQVASLVWQTMVGVWPLEQRSAMPNATWRQRVIDYLVKAEREASQRTTWTDPDAAFENALQVFLDDLLADDGFRRQFDELARQAAEIAMVTGLSQTLLRCTAPGIPDTYQGMELWDDSLVDPDNRRPVDWQRLRQEFAELAEADASMLWATRRDGRVKAFVLSRALQLRRSRPELFGAGAGYHPVNVTGPQSAHVIAYVRQSDDAQALMVATRLPGGLQTGSDGRKSWGDTVVEVPGNGRLTDVFTGRDCTTDTAVGVAEVLGSLPVALLVTE